MFNILNQLLECGSSNCLHCGSFFVGNSLLCSYCEKILFLQCSVKELWKNEEQGIPYYSLFSWEQDKNLILNKLILNLKGNKQKKAYSYFGKIISIRLQKEFSQKSRMLICPCPSWGKNKDHAFFLAQEISINLGVDMAIPLINGIKKQESKQLTKAERIKNIEERFIINTEFCEKFTQANQKTIVFVDDVITTGATLLAASEKLKDFKQIIGVSLAFRR